MQRRIFCATAALAASLCLSTGAYAQTKWDMATAYPAFNFHSKNIEQFVQDVDTATKGSLKITPPRCLAVQNARNQAGRANW